MKQGIQRKYKVEDWANPVPIEAMLSLQLIL